MNGGLEIYWNYLTCFEFQTNSLTKNKLYKLVTN